MCSLVGMLRGTILVFVGMMAFAAVGAPTAQASSGKAAGGAWAQARARVPAGVAVFRPTWLPARLDQPPTVPDQRYFAGITEPVYEVAYVSADGTSYLRFSLGPVNGGAPNWSEALAVGGVTGRIYTTPAGWWPPIGVDWQETGSGRSLFYAIQGRGISQEELRRVATSLVRMGTNAPELPQSGAGGLAIDHRPDPALALVLACTVILASRLVTFRPGHSR